MHFSNNVKNILIMNAHFVEEEDTNKVNERISHLLNTYYSSDEEEEQEQPSAYANSPTDLYRPKFENRNFDNQLRNRNNDTERQPVAPEFDLSKIVGAFTSMMKPKEKPKPKIQNYITKMYDIVVANLLMIIHFLLPEDMVAPAEGLIKGRLSAMVQEEVLDLQQEHKYLYKLALSLCCILYYLYQYRLVVAFANGMFWGAYLF